MLLFFMLACPAPPSDTDDTSGGADTGADTAADTADTAADTADTAADTADTSDSGDTGAAPLVVNYVLTSYTVADRGEGFDVDGDGDLDNAIAPIGGMLDPLVAQGLATAQHVVIEQIGGLDAWTDDADIRVGVASATDEDGDGSDNESGTEVFDPGPAVDADGNVIVATNTALVAGEYEVQLATGALPIGSYELEFATGVFIEAAPTAAAETGLIGFGISLEVLETALTAEGVSPELIAVVETLADLDLDADGSPDAISMAFHFEASACLLTP